MATGEEKKKKKKKKKADGLIYNALKDAIATQNNIVPSELPIAACGSGMSHLKEPMAAATGIGGVSLLVDRLGRWTECRQEAFAYGCIPDSTHKAHHYFGRTHLYTRRYFSSSCCRRLSPRPMTVVMHQRLFFLEPSSRHEGKEKDEIIADKAKARPRQAKSRYARFASRTDPCLRRLRLNPT